MSAALQRFAFDRIFAPGSANAPVGPEALTLEIERLRAELADARAEILIVGERSFETGRAAALVELHAERDTALLAATDALGAALERIEANIADTQALLSRDAADLALAAADHLAGRALMLDPAAAIDQAIGRALEHLRRGTPIAVRVHPDLLAAIESRLAARQTVDRRRLPITPLADDTLALGDARLEWDSGRLCLDAAARRAAITAELDALGAD